MEKIGSKIKKMRELKNISVKEMADHLDMTVSGYHKIERNEVDINSEKMEKIAKILGVEAKDLMAFDEKAISFNSWQTNQNLYAYCQIENPSERQLYERLLQEKEAVISALKEEIALLKQMNEYLRGKN
jgi:transcriptional regulator with XRE-family HTH domain